MKKRLAGIIAALLPLSLIFSGCAAAGAKTVQDKISRKTVTLKIQASATPHAEILDFVKKKLSKEGVRLEITSLSDDAGIESLEQIEDGEFDVNYCGHLPWLKSIQQSKPELKDLVSAGAIHVEPIGFYSVRYKNKKELPKGATIAVPNDTSNEYRALKILEQNGFISLKKDISTNSATTRDIQKYLKPIKIVEMDSQIIIRDRNEFDGYITNTNKMLEAGLDPNAFLFREDSKSPFANILIVKKSRRNDAAVKKLYSAMASPSVKKFIEDKYKGAVIPAF